MNRQYPLKTNPWSPPTELRLPSDTGEGVEDGKKSDYKWHEVIRGWS